MPGPPVRIIQTTSHLENLPLTYSGQSIAMVRIQRLPTEIFCLVVDQLMDGGLYGSAVALARTNRTCYHSTIEIIYKFVIVKKTFFVAHWAAEHGRIDTLRRAIKQRANVSEPFPRLVPWGRWRPAYRRLDTTDLCVEELAAAVTKRCSLMKLVLECRPCPEHWYHRTASTFKEIGRDLMSRLTAHYRLFHWEQIDTDFGKFASAPETMRMFLDAFVCWATPLHIAIREGKADIIQELLRKDADVNASSYGSCHCRSRYDSTAVIKHALAFSPLHQALCEKKLEGHNVQLQLIRRGAAYLTLTNSMLKPSVSQQPIKPTFAVQQPHTLLHEAVSWPGACVAREDWSVEMLLDNGYESRLQERDDQGRLAVEIAVTNRISPTVTDLLRRD